MLDRLLDLLGQQDESEAAIDDSDHTLSAAVLLVEAARMDHVIEEEEKERITQLLEWRFELSEGDANALLEKAIAESAESHSFHRHSLAIRRHFSEPERITLVELLWDIAYIDGELHEREASLMRKIAGLLYVTDQDSGAARKRAQERLGIDRA